MRRRRYPLPSVAYTAEEGLAKFHSEQPDLVLLDLLLPDMHGFEVFRRMREVRYVPIVILTGQVRFSDRVAGLELGADEYLIKPFATDELVATVRRILDKQRSKD